MLSVASALLVSNMKHVFLHATRWILSGLNHPKIQNVGITLWIVFNPSTAQAEERSVASKMFSRLAGYPLSLDDPRRADMETAIRNMQRGIAARIATEDPGFYNVTLKQWAAPMSNRALSPMVPLNDFIALVVGMVRDDLDFRLALTGDIWYSVDFNLPVFAVPTVLTPVSAADNIYPTGFVTQNNGWVARFTASQASSVISLPDGSANTASGNGIKSLGTMLANSRAFPACMAKRVFESVCVRPAVASDDADIAALAQHFVSSGYKVRSLFEKTAELASCVGQ